MGPRRCEPGRFSRRLRPRRGGRPGGIRDRCRALAARRHARQPGRVADDDGTEPRDRSHPPRANVRAEGAPDRGSRGSGGRGGRSDVSRRAARAALYVLPPRALTRRAGRADPPHPRRPPNRRDRPCVPRAGADHGAATRPREAQDQSGRHPVSRTAAAPLARAAHSGARRRLPHLQRGLCRAPRPRRRRDPTRLGDLPSSCRTRPRRTRSSR